MLDSQDYLQVLACVEAIHQCRTLADFPQQILAALSLLISSNLSAFNEVNAPRRRIVAYLDRPAIDHEKLTVLWEKYSAQHPLLRYYTETGDGQAVKISDFLSSRDYHRLDLYRALYREIDAEDQMTLTIRSDNGVFLTLAFNRERRSFRESDRIKLNLVRPHIVRAYANAEELAGRLEEKADLQTALRETGHGLLAVDPFGKLTELTPGALQCVRRYFPSVAEEGRLPEPLSHWLCAGAVKPVKFRHGSGRLIVRSPSNSERRILLLSEEGSLTSVGTPPLTPRESEVLQWLAEGKSNAEIAIILNLAPGTVKLHVEHILGKLGVDNRTAAAAFARDERLHG